MFTLLGLSQAQTGYGEVTQALHLARVRMQCLQQRVNGDVLPLARSLARWLARSHRGSFWE